MTTRAWSYPIDHQTDAAFRAWVTDFAAKLAEVGLVQTADTGQINIATATRPAVDTVAGYQIWKFSDNSIFLKFEYGTSATAVTSPNVWMTVGTGSNGSGTITGTSSARRKIAYETGLTVIAARLSYMSHSVADGFFGFVGYIDSAGANHSRMTAMVARSVDANGVPSSQGATVYWKEPVSSIPGFMIVQALNFLTNTAQPVVANTGTYGFVPYGITNTSVGLDQQAFVHWTAFPRASPVMQMATVSATEFPTGTGFLATLVGSTPKNYITLDQSLYGTPATSTAFRIAMLWE